MSNKNAGTNPYPAGDTVYWSKTRYDELGRAVETFAPAELAVQQNTAEVVTVEEEEVWTPTAIEDCMSKVDVGEPFKYETSLNPFYLRADFDGNGLVDYAVLIKGQTTKTRGVVICKDSKQPFCIWRVI